MKNFCLSHADKIRVDHRYFIVIAELFSSAKNMCVTGQATPTVPVKRQAHRLWGKGVSHSMRSSEM